eukprot:scaffold385_cov305-Pinguiococcus_pyrenoidosus.AAC.48
MAYLQRLQVQDQIEEDCEARMDSQGWSAAKKDSKRAIELNNGRAAQMGILALMVHEKLDNNPYIINSLIGKATCGRWKSKSGVAIHLSIFPRSSPLLQVPRWISTLASKPVACSRR